MTRYGYSKDLTPVEFFDKHLGQLERLIVLECAKQGLRDELFSGILDLDVSDDLLEHVYQKVSAYMETERNV